jgi:CheY-like chemotaxis protein
LAEVVRRFGICHDEQTDMAEVVPMKPSAGVVVLLAEDSTDVREMFATAWESRGVQTIEADNGLDALTRAADPGVDAVVTDLGLPGIDGLELCARLKSDARTAGIPVIALSGRSPDDVSETRGQARFDAVLLKPCLPDALLQEILNAIDRRAVRRGAGVANGSDRHDKKHQ